MISASSTTETVPTSPSSSPTPSSSNARSPGPQDPLDPLSANFLSDLAIVQTFSVHGLRESVLRLNCRMLLGFSGYQEYEIASRLNACAIDFSSVHRVVAPGLVGSIVVCVHGPLILFWGMLTCLVFVPMRTQEAKEGFASNPYSTRSNPRQDTNPSCFGIRLRSPFGSCCFDGAS